MPTVRSRGYYGCLLVLVCAPLAVFGGPSGMAPAASGPAGTQFFEQKIRPVLAQHCYKCHAAGAKKPRGGLRLDTRAGLLQGGTSGPAIIPGQPAKSLLLKALRHQEIAMPPKGKLPANVIADFERWIRMGAPDPRNGQATAAVAPPDLQADRPFWAFQPLRRHDVPHIMDNAWPRSDIDRFILAALEARGLRPVRDADRTTLIRRVTLDLIGLPPTPNEVAAFVHDPAPDALVRVVDRLLASPHFGERWGRHWLDVARYADSNGKDENLTFHEAFRYRDYVIASFNHDKPFDQFVMEQIAGDLMPAADPARRDEHLTGTGFLVVGPKVLADRDFLKRKMDVVDEQIDTIGRVFLGLTLGCARCHDHKFDPIPTTDYYALAGIFASTRTLDGIKLGNAVVSGWMLQPLGADGEGAWSAYKAHQKKQTAVVAALKKARAELKHQEQLAARRPATLADLRARIQQLEVEANALKTSAPPMPALVMAVKDEAKPANVRVNIRGNPHHLGVEVPRRGLITVAASDQKPAIPANQSGRLELARWVVQPSNPLTARVLVNRVWQHLLGEGLVRTVDNFGKQGERPTHPELLDELARRFMEDGWSVKRLIRTIVLSRVYQLRSDSESAAAKVDPENRLLWRAQRRRVEAEVLRDAILTVSGDLERTMGGPVVAGLGERAIDNDSRGGVPTETNHRRGVYLPVIRNDLPPFLEVFDFADPDVATGRRHATTVPTQALFLMNSPFVMGQARQTARRLLALPADDAGRLAYLYRLALGRLPTPKEPRSALRFLADYRQGLAPTPDRDTEAWAAVCQAMFSCTEFRFVD